MNKPHKHAEVIKAWADGAEIEFRSTTTGGEWWFTSQPTWVEDVEYRVKPQPKKYRVDVWLCFYPDDGDLASVIYETPPSLSTLASYRVVHHTLEGELPNV